MKKILIAIPSAKYIESDTFKSIYDLIIPDGYKADFQYFFGYQIDQIRNKIVEFSLNNNYEYTFCVDSDIVFKSDTLSKLMYHNVDIVSGVYRQRLPNNIVEIYDKNYRNLSIDIIMENPLTEIGACGFGCVLVKNKVFREIEYPHFVYKSALDHKNTFSEDIYFCKKAREKGFKVFVNSRVICGHIGSYNYSIDDIYKDTVLDRFKELRSMDLLPKEHVDFLYRLRDNNQVRPMVIYDIGASVLHWRDKAQEVWPDSKIIAFEAMEEVKTLYDQEGIPYCLGVLSDKVKKVDFYKNLEHPGGNSYYKENSQLSIQADILYTENNKKEVETITLDIAVNYFNFPKPDLIKIDVQGAELDILKGAEETIKDCKFLIVELQHKEYNKGAPNKDIIIEYLEGLGYNCVGMFCSSQSGFDGDYFFFKD